MNNRKGILKATEWIALLVVMHYCAFCFMRPTSFVFEYSPVYRKLTFLSLALVGSFRLLVGLWCEFKEVGITKGFVLKVLLIGISGICCLLLEIRFEYTFFLFMLFAAFCLYGIDADKILKAFTVCIGAMLASVVLCCLTGIIPNYIYLRTTDTHDKLLRASYGISYTTDFASYIFFLILLFWCGGKRKPVLPLLGLIALAIWFIYNQTNSYSSELCLLLTAVIILWEALEHRFFRNRTKILNISGWIAVSAFPLLGIGFYGLTWLYGQGNTFAIQADSLLHSRLSLTWEGIQTFGINAFGAATSQNGAGGGDIPKWTDGYNFLDSSYGLMLVRYGWVLTLIVTVLWVWMTRKAMRNGYRSLAYAMAIIAVHSFSEHHFTDIQYNVLLAMPLCCLICRKETEQEERVQTEKRIIKWIPWLTAGGTAVVCFLLLPTGLAYLRTAYELKGWENSLWAFLCCLICMILIGLLVFFLSKMIVSLTEKKKPYWIGLACTVCALCTVFLWAGMTVNSGKEEERLSADAEPLQVILATAKEPVYVDSLEALYQQKYPGISRRIWTVEEMAGIQKGTILTDREPELNKLISTGAIYAEISDFSSIYTYDWDVAEALKSSGHICHGFYYTECALDNEKLAELNDLERTEDGALLLTEDKNSIVEEPDLSLYEGNYRTTFDFSLDSQEVEGTVCTVAVTTYEGEKRILEREVSAEEFDETGHATIICDCLIGSSRTVRFEIQGYASLRVEKISWRRRINTDTWRKYDIDGRLNKEFYFSLDGQPYKQWLGFSGIQFDYSAGRNIVTVLYLDANGNLIRNFDGYAKEERIYDSNNHLISQKYFDDQNHIVENCAGYAEIQREYSTRGKMIREAYYDAKGQPVIKHAGFSAIMQDFNESGDLILRRYLDKDGQSITRKDGYMEVKWIPNKETGALDAFFFAENGKLVNSSKINLARDIPGDAECWSTWMMPEYNVLNSCRYIGSVNLGDKKTGDVFTCRVEVEFRGVTGTEGAAFGFRTQGAADGKWDKGNVWNNNLINLNIPPQDGVYTFMVTNTVNEKMLSVTDFDMGFRCDNWKSGMFRVRKVMVVSGDTIGEWSPGI